MSRSSGTETVVLDAKELATRKEIEKAWLKYWDIYVEFNKVPVAQRPAKFGAVAVDPELSAFLHAAEVADSKNIENRGVVRHRIFWASPVSNRTSVVIGDCTDETKLQVVNSKDGTVLSHGGPEGKYNGTMKRIGNTWKVSFLAFRGAGC